MTIADFLLERIAEQEALARCGWDEAGPWPAADAVLAECAAKRAIVALHQPLDNDPEPFCWNCDEDAWPCKTTRALAAVYAAHPDYDESWTL